MGGRVPTPARVPDEPARAGHWFNMTRVSSCELWDTPVERRIRPRTRPPWRNERGRRCRGRGGGSTQLRLAAVAEKRAHPELADRPRCRVAVEWGCTTLDVMLDCRGRWEGKTETALLARCSRSVRPPMLLHAVSPKDNVILGLADLRVRTVSQVCDAVLTRTDLSATGCETRRMMPLAARDPQAQRRRRRVRPHRTRARRGGRADERGQC